MDYKKSPLYNYLGYTERISHTQVDHSLDDSVPSNIITRTIYLECNNVNL